jgi:hypothetical protein
MLASHSDGWNHAFRKMQTLIGVLGMLNHQDQSGTKTEILGVRVIIEEQKIGTDTGMTGHLRDHQEVTGILKEERKDQKDVNMMTWIVSVHGMMTIVNAVKEEGD